MKKALCLGLILAIFLSGFSALAAPSISVTGGSEGRVSVNGAATEGSPVTLIVLNDGFTLEDITKNNPGAAQYVKVQNADAEGYAFQDIRLNEQGEPLEETVRNAAGVRVACKDGTFRKVYIYDESGTRRLCTEYYDRDGKLLRSENH